MVDESGSIQSSPLSELPQDVIMEIFALLCKPITAVDSISESWKVYDRKLQPITPLFLGSICRAWRSAIWNSPSLWSSVVLSLSANRERCATQTALLQEWVARSGVIPLSLHLTTDEVTTGAEPSWREIASLKELYCVLDSYAERWKALEIIFPSGSGLSFEHIFPKISRESPALSSLMIRPPLGYNVEERSVTIHLSSSAAPLLCHVKLRPFFLSDISLPWSQLLSITAYQYSVDECQKILRRSLTHCRLEIFGSMELGSIFLPNITSLEIYNSEPSAIKCLMMCCSCPAIEKLIIHQRRSSIYMPNSVDMVANLTKFISRSSPDLRYISLSITSSEIPSESQDLIRLLTAATTIEILYLKIIRNSNDFIGLPQSFLDHLDPRIATKMMLPNLREFSYTGFVDFIPLNLIDVLKCRWEYDTAAKLKSATICVANIYQGFQLTEDDTRCLKELAKSGMDISINRLTGCQ